MQTIQSRSPREFATLRWVPLFGQSSHRSDICPAVVNKWMRINSALISDVGFTNVLERITKTLVNPTLFPSLLLSEACWPDCCGAVFTKFANSRRTWDSVRRALQRFQEVRSGLRIALRLNAVAE